MNYAKRQQGRRVYAAQSTHLPLKVNMAGVIPAIFASSIILFPATIASWFGGGTGWNWLTTIICCFTRVEDQRRVEETEEDDRRRIE